MAERNTEVNKDNDVLLAPSRAGAVLPRVRAKDPCLIWQGTMALKDDLLSRARGAIPFRIRGAFDCKAVIGFSTATIEITYTRVVSQQQMADELHVACEAISLELADEPVHVGILGPKIVISAAPKRET